MTREEIFGALEELWTQRDPMPDGLVERMQALVHAEVALADWRVLLSALDRLRSQRKMSIVCLCHAKIAPFKNPEGEDYDRYRPTLHDKTWGLTLKWSDAALFVNFETFTEKDGLRAKGRGGQQRVMYTERRAAFDAAANSAASPCAGCMRTR